MLKTLDEEQIRSKLLKEVLDDCQSHDDPKHLQSVFLLLIAIRDYENAWRMIQERKLADPEGDEPVNAGFVDARR
ncbi:MAG: hypothetical protein U0936_18950 [Planctomycetaceae bacterium]